MRRTSVAGSHTASTARLIYGCVKDQLRSPRQGSVRLGRASSTGQRNTSASREDSVTRPGRFTDAGSSVGGAAAVGVAAEGAGWPLRKIGPQVGCSHELVRIIARQAPRRPVRVDGWVPGPGRLTLADREEISIGLHAGESLTAIAARLGRAVSAVSREVAASGGREAYRAWRAHQRARGQARRPKPCKLARPPAGRPGHQAAGRVVVTGADLPPVADRAPGRSHDVGEPRNHLPIPVCAGPRWAAPRTSPLPAHRAGQAPPARPRGPGRPHQEHGDDQRTARRSRRCRRSERPLRPTSGSAAPSPRAGSGWCPRRSG